MKPISEIIDSLPVGLLESCPEADDNNFQFNISPGMVFGASPIKKSRGRENIKYQQSGRKRIPKRRRFPPSPLQCFSTIAYM